MAFTLLLKRSSTTTHVPTPAQLQDGELAVNIYDGLLFFRKNQSGTLSTITLGPVPPTANALTVARTISCSGDATGSVPFDGSANVAIPLVLAASGVTPGTYGGVVVNAKGLVTAAIGSGTGVPAEIYGNLLLAPLNSSQIIVRLVTARNILLPSGLSGSQAVVSSVPTAAVALMIYRNGISIGSINFTAGAAIGSFTMANAVTFGAGDVLQIVGPSTADATFGNLSFCFAGSRT